MRCALTAVLVSWGHCSNASMIFSSQPVLAVCCVVAQGIRSLGLQVPEHCNKHEPPCLMQHAALIDFESYLIQFSIIRMAHGLPPLTIPPPVPANHPFPTFEYQLPLSFDDAVKVDTAHLVRPGSQPITASTRTPVISCRFCDRENPYVRVTTLWIHIRDKHDLIDRDARLEEIKSIGTTWCVIPETLHPATVLAVLLGGII